MMYFKYEYVFTFYLANRDQIYSKTSYNRNCEVQLTIDFDYSYLVPLHDVFNQRVY